VAPAPPTPGSVTRKRAREEGILLAQGDEERAANTVKEGDLRNIGEVVAERRAWRASPIDTRQGSQKKMKPTCPEGLPAWLPDPGFGSWEEAFEAMNKLLGDITTGKGAASMVKTDGNKVRPGTCGKMGHGPRFRSRCSYGRPVRAAAGKKKTSCTGTECPIFADFELVKVDDDGKELKVWVVRHTNMNQDADNDGHNHQLPQDRATANAHANLRSIPDDLCIIGEALKDKESAAEIRATLCELARKWDREVTWTKNDVETAFRPNTEEKKLDASNFLQRLLDMKDAGRYAKHSTDEDGKLNRALWTFEGARQAAAKAGHKLFVIFDNTFGTNRYGLKLGILSTVDEHGRTIALGASLMLKEDFESFAMVFEWMHEAFPECFEVMLTDGDATRAAAIKLMFGAGVVHHLCTWHLAKNFAFHLKKLFTQEDWKKVNLSWWAIVLEGELSYQGLAFDADWQRLVDLVLHVARPTTEDAVLTAARTWLGGPNMPDQDEDSLYSRREKFARCYTAREFTCNSAASSRGEGYFALMKRGKRKAGSLLVAVVKKLEDLAERTANLTTTGAVTRALRAVTAGRGSASKPAMLAAIDASNVTPYLKDLLRLVPQQGQLRRHQGRGAERLAHDVDGEVHGHCAVCCPWKCPCPRLRWRRRGRRGRGRCVPAQRGHGAARPRHPQRHMQRGTRAHSHSHGVGARRDPQLLLLVRLPELAPLSVQAHHEDVRQGGRGHPELVHRQALARSLA